MRRRVFGPHHVHRHFGGQVGGIGVSAPWPHDGWTLIGSPRQFSFTV
jgi:hypothetical protein